MEYNGDRHWFDSFRRIVCLLVAFELSAYSEVNFAMLIEARIFGPQAGKFLPHGAESILSCARLDRSTMERNSTISVVLGEDLEDWNRVAVVVELWIEVVLVAESKPPLPMVVV